MDVCIVLEDEEPREFHLREIRSLMKVDGFEVPLVLVDKTYDSSDEVTIHSGVAPQIKEFLRKLARREFLVLVNLEQKIADALLPSRTVTEERRELEARRDLFQVEGMEDSEVVEFEPRQTGEHTYEFPEDVLKEIEGRCDVVVLLGFSKILRGDVLNLPEHGVLSFHGADIRRYRGRPGAFFQFLNDEEEIGLTLQQLTEELDGGKIVVCRHADIRDARSWKEARYRVEQLYGDVLVEGLEKLEDGFEPQKPEPPGKLTYSREGHELANVYRCLKKTIRRRYLP